MDKNRIEHSEETFKVAAIAIILMILCLIIGANIELFDGEINDNVPHRSIVVTNDGMITTITGTVHRYNNKEYLKLKRIITLPSLKVSEKTVQRMAEELDRSGLYFNKQIRSK